MSYESALLIRNYRAMLESFRDILGCAENDQDVNIPFKSTGTFDGIRSLCIDGEKKFARIKRNYSMQEIYAPLLHVIIRSFRNHLTTTEIQNLESTLQRKDSRTLGFDYLMPICQHGINDVSTKDFYQNVRLGIAWMLSENKTFEADFIAAKSKGIDGILKLYARNLGIIIYAYDIDKKPEAKENKKKRDKNEESDEEDNDNKGDEDESTDDTSKVSSISTRGVYAGGDRGVAVIGIKNVGKLMMCLSIEPEEKITTLNCVGDTFFADPQEAKKIIKLSTKAVLCKGKIKAAGKKKHKKGEEDEDEDQEPEQNEEDENKKEDDDDDDKEVKVVKSSATYKAESTYISGGTYHDYITELSEAIIKLVPKEEKIFKRDPPNEFPFTRIKIQN